MATPQDRIPLKHLPLDVLQRLIARREEEARGQTSPPPRPPAPPDDPEGGVEALLASVGLRTQPEPAVDLEPLRGELARRRGEGRETARQRSALYRSHLSVGLQEYRGKLTKAWLEQFIVEAGARLYEETGAPSLYLLVPPPIYRQRLAAIYNVYGAAIAGQPRV